MKNKVSTTALRYLSIALDIKNKFGDKIDCIAEIGAGYGGQALILSRICKVQQYHFFDLWQVNKLIRRFTEFTDFDPEYSLNNVREITNTSRKYDLCISNYAFSEFDAKAQSIYMKKVIMRSNSGYMLMNTGLNGSYDHQDNLHLHIDVIKSFVPGIKISNESPQTGEFNYLITW